MQDNFGRRIDSDRYRNSRLDIGHFGSVDDLQNYPSGCAVPALPATQEQYLYPL